MAVDTTGRVLTRHFRALAKITTTVAGSLAWILRAILQELARGQARRLGLAPLTDSSGGTAGSEVGEITIPDVTDTSSSGGATVASVNSALDTVMNAFATLMQRLNLVRARLGMGSAPTGPGTLGAGTIAAITVSVSSASGNSSASQATVASALGDVLDRQRTVIRCIDEVRTALGLDTVAVETVQGAFDLALTMAAITDAAAVAAGTSATTGVAKADIDAQLSILRDNVAFLADMVDECYQAPRRRVHMSIDVSSTLYAAGGIVYFIAPCAGRFRRLRAVNIGDTTDEAGEFKYKIASTDVTGSVVTVATSVAAGTAVDSGEIADHASNLFTEGTVCQLVVANSTAGAFRVQIEIEPLEIDAAIPAYAGLAA